MNEEKYCVLWMPTKHERTDWAKMPTNQSKKCNISDKGKPLYISALKQENSNNIQIKHHFGRFSKKIVCSINLDCIDTTPYGLFLYKYEYNIEDKDAAKLASIVKSRAVYHLVKEIYHKHEFHHQEDDSILKPLHSDIKINLTSPNNCAIEFFLKRWDDYFHAKAIHDIIRNHKEFLKYTKNKKLRERSKVIKYSKETKKFIDDALGYFLYCKTLLDSVDSAATNFNESNIKTHIDSINTSISKIKEIQKLFLDEYSFVSSYLSIGLGRLSFDLAILSLFLGIIALPSAYSSITSMFSKSKSIDDVYEIQKILLYNDSIQLKNIEKQNIQLDTIDKRVIQLNGKNRNN
jgi:hypothetical protein